MTIQCNAPFCENSAYHPTHKSFCLEHKRERRQYNVKAYKEVLPVWAGMRCKIHGLLPKNQCSKVEHYYKCRECKRLNKNKNFCPKKAKEYRIKAWPSAKVRYYKKKFGISSNKQNEMLVSQNHLCAICNKPQQEFKGKSKSLYLDHCHVSGNARAFLCASCNSGLGNFKDNPTVMQEAIKYLQHHKDAQV